VDDVAVITRKMAAEVAQAAPDSSSSDISQWADSRRRSTARHLSAGLKTKMK
jgi:Ni/Co efflux regulator RcnB